MALKDFVFDKDLIFLKENFSNREDLLRFLAEKLLERGLVKDSFVDAVLKREEEHPTGIYLGEINVAIPHTDIEYTNFSSVAVMTLLNPVIFRRMDDPNSEIQVYIVFMLAIKDPNEYVNFLGTLASKFSNSDFIKRISSETKKENVFEYLKEIINGG
ncbi:MULTISPECIES: PTS sugar transporter subunit IIA [Bacteria]|jgi:PTS system galactitol-specific IIA component|uniref:PTS sugar transporter subunit IIA n=1 Tax=Bacteria TaxID=2 RepID=UPI003C7ECB2E